MRKFAIFAVAALFAAATVAPVSFMGMESAALAAKAKGGKEKGPKAAPGKCGTGMFYDKKKKKCADASESKK